MTSEEPSRTWNYRHRAVGAAICLAPVLLFVVSLIASQIAPRDSGMGLGVVVCALPVAILNFHLSFVRPALYRWRRGTLEGFRHISGFPLFGTLLLVIGGVIGFGDWRAAAIGLVAVALDTGGLPWFLVMTWRDDSLWDTRG